MLLGCASSFSLAQSFARTPETRVPSAWGSVCFALAAEISSQISCLPLTPLFPLPNYSPKNISYTRTHTNLHSRPPPRHNTSGLFPARTFRRLSSPFGNAGPSAEPTLVFRQPATSMNRSHYHVSHPVSVSRSASTSLECVPSPLSSSDEVVSRPGYLSSPACLIVPVAWISLDSRRIQPQRPRSDFFVCPLSDRGEKESGSIDPIFRLHGQRLPESPAMQ